MEIKTILAALIISLPFFGLAQTDTTKTEEDTVDYEFVDYTEYYHVTKNSVDAYPEDGTFEDDVLDTIAFHIRTGSLITTNKDVNLNVAILAREWRQKELRKIGSADTIGIPISDDINNTRSINSLFDFRYPAYEYIGKPFVLHIFDQTESCECSKSIFQEITGDKYITEALVDPRLKWMTFSYFQHTTEQGFDEEFIFVRWKRKWGLLTREYMIILGD
jgi:hypothetical protein